MDNTDIISVDQVSMRFALASEKVDSLKEYFIKRNLIVWYEDLVKHWSLKTKKLFIGG